MLVSRLLIDCGNSRLKGALHGPAGLRPLAPLALGPSAPACPTLVAWLTEALACPDLAEITTPAGAAVGQSTVPEVLVSNVRGAAFAGVLQAACTELGWDAVRFASASGCARPFASRYDLARLGIDRYLAVLAAVELGRGGPVAVIDGGTAVTLDFISAEGVHTGGIIAPGLALMRRSLGQQTKGLGPHIADEATLDADAVKGASGVTALPPTESRTAIEQGVLLALEGLIASSLARYDPDARCRVFVTGGDADAVAVSVAKTGREVSVIESLVPQGLLRWAGLPLPGMGD